MLKYFDGQSLATVAKRKGAMSESEAREYLKAIAKAMKYCHEQGVAHGDLKAENVLVNAAGGLKLIDFAFAFKGEPGEKVATYCGTQSYMAPEIFDKAPHCPRQADVWAFGVLAFRLVVGELPFACKSAEARPEKAARVEALIREADVPREKLASCSSSFSAFVLRCLAKDPADRPSFTDLLRDGWLTESK